MIWKFLGAVFGSWLSSWWTARLARKQIAQTAVEHAENVQLKQELKEEGNASAERAKAITDLRHDDLPERVRDQYID